LENAIERAVVIAPGDEISRECLRPEIADPQAARAVVREAAGAASSIDVSRGINFYDECGGLRSISSDARSIRLVGTIRARPGCWE
jgi:hypothetical protein